MTFALRPMQPGDLDQILAIAAAAPEVPRWPRSAWAAYLSPDPGNKNLLRFALVAEASTPPDPEETQFPRPPVLLGFACASLLCTPDSPAAQNLCELDSMAVLPAARRRGIGANLLRALLAWAAQNGAHRFSLEVRASNTPAIALYQGLGFLPEGRRPRYYTDPEEDALLLGISVTPGTP